MIERLKTKWKVSAGRLLLILVTFAVGGSLTGLLGRKIMSYSGIENPFLYAIVYIVAVTVIWPAMVLVVSIPFGQFIFFKKYLRQLSGKIARRNKKPGSQQNQTSESQHYL